MSSNLLVRGYFENELPVESKEAVMHLIFAYLAHNLSSSWTSDEENLLIEEHWRKMRPLVFFRPETINSRAAWKSTIEFICTHDFMQKILDLAAFDSEEDLQEHCGIGIFETVPDLLADLNKPGTDRRWAGQHVMDRTHGTGLTSQFRMDLMFHFTVSSILRDLRDMAGKAAHPGRRQMEIFH